MDAPVEQPRQVAPKLTVRIMKKTKVEQEEVWPGAAERAKSVAQAKGLRKQARKGGLRFEAYLPSQLAIWLLGLIEQGVFLDPSEAVFVILGQHRELEPHADLRRELLGRVVKSALDDPRPSIPSEKVFKDLRKMLAAPRPEPAAWRRSSAQRNDRATRRTKLTASELAADLTFEGPGDLSTNPKHIAGYGESNRRGKRSS
jgi:antitoxin ParD1/3/4